MAEGLYSFDVYTYDNAGHSSVKAEVTGTVYGDNYASSIFNRALDFAKYDSVLKKLTIQWFGASQQAVVVDVDYTDSLGEPKTLYITKVQPLDLRKAPLFLNTDVITDYKAGTTFSYRTGYLPSATAIDTFYTDYREITPTF